MRPIPAAVQNIENTGATQRSDFQPIFNRLLPKCVCLRGSAPEPVGGLTAPPPNPQLEKVGSHQVLRPPFSHSWIRHCHLYVWFRVGWSCCPPFCVLVCLLLQPSVYLPLSLFQSTHPLPAISRKALPGHIVSISTTFMSLMQT